MSYTVEFLPEAIVDLEALTSSIQERILRKIRWLSENFDQVSLQALSSETQLLRLQLRQSIVYKLVERSETQDNSTKEAIALNPTTSQPIPEFLKMPTV